MSEKKNKTIRNNKGQIFEHQKIGDSEGEQFDAYTNQKPQWISPTKLRMPNGKIVSMDPNETSFEIYNPNKYVILMQNNHYNPQDFLTNPAIITCPPDSFALIPHSYYIPHIEKIGAHKGEAIPVIQNFGDQMFINNKNPSPPTMKKAQVFQSK